MNSDVEKVAETTPQEIAKMSEVALASCLQSANHLRALGKTCKGMAEQVDRACCGLADDFEAHGQTVSKSVTQFAEKVYEQAMQVREMRKAIHPYAAPIDQAVANVEEVAEAAREIVAEQPPPEADFYGKKKNGNGGKVAR